MNVANTSRASRLQIQLALLEKRSREVSLRIGRSITARRITKQPQVNWLCFEALSGFWWSPQRTFFHPRVTNGSTGIFEASRVARTRARGKIVGTIENSCRADIERWFMVMDSADYYRGIIYHANTVEFQCTCRTSIVGDQRALFVPLHSVSVTITLRNVRNFLEMVESLFHVTQKIVETKFFLKRKRTLQWVYLLVVDSVYTFI